MAEMSENVVEEAVAGDKKEEAEEQKDDQNEEGHSDKGKKTSQQEEDEDDEDMETLKKPASKLAKAKAKAKSKAASMLKRPAASSSRLSTPKKQKVEKVSEDDVNDDGDQDEDDEMHVMKKPASKGKGVIQKKPSTKSSISKQVAKAAPKPKSKKEGFLAKFQPNFSEEHDDKDDDQEHGEEEEPEEDPEVDGSRDRSKSNRFFHLMKKGDLPEAVLAAWNASHSRQKQTELINSLFIKKGRTYIVKPDFELPETYKKVRETERVDSAKDAQSGFGKTIFCRKFGLSEEDLAKCVESGEVRAFKSGGVTLYAAVNVQISSGVNKKTMEQLGMEERSLSDEASKAFLAVFETLEPTVNLDGPSSSRPTTLKNSLPGRETQMQIGLIMNSCLFGSCFLRIVIYIYT